MVVRPTGSRGWFSPRAKHSTTIRLSVPSAEALLRWARANATFDKPVLLIWGTEDKVRPIEHGRRLARLYPNARLVELDDTYTLIPIDRPGDIVTEIESFIPHRALS